MDNFAKDVKFVFVHTYNSLISLLGGYKAEEN